MILATGGAGYVGSHFVRAYRSKLPKAPIVVVDDLSTGHRESLPDENIHFYQVNIGDKSRMAEIFKQHTVDCVVHFAASAYVCESQKEPFKYLENNLVNSINLFQSMDSAGVRKIVFSSTCATYGLPQSIPIDESHPQEPVNVYGLTKLMIEKTLDSLASTLGWSYAALRYFNAAGAHPEGIVGESHVPETHIIPLLLAAAVNPQVVIPICGTDYPTTDGTCVRDYIHVMDLADAHLSAIDHLLSGKPNLLVNLGTSSGASVLELIELCQEVTGRKIQTVPAARRWGDPPTLVADYSKAASVLAWKPKHTLKSIIETAWNWEQNRLY